MGTQKNRLNEMVLLSTQNIFQLMNKNIIEPQSVKTSLNDEVVKIELIKYT